MATILHMSTKKAKIDNMRQRKSESYCIRLGEQIRYKIEWSGHYQKESESENMRRGKSESDYIRQIGYEIRKPLWKHIYIKHFFMSRKLRSQNITASDDSY